MYDPQLEKLVDMALVDGVITEKEKDILVKRAKSLGADLDEFEMYLDSRLASLSNTQNTTTSQKKLGDLLKCPSCGASVPSLTIICKDCGFEFRNVSANSSVIELSERLEQASKTLSTKQNEYGYSFALSAQIEIIKGFIIPNTKDDLMEFALYLAPKIKTYSFFNEWDEGLAGLNSTYITKYQEIILKAKVIGKDDPSFSKSIINLVENRNINIRTNFFNPSIWAATIFVFIGFFGTLILFPILHEFVFNETGKILVTRDVDIRAKKLLWTFFITCMVLSIVSLLLGFKYRSKPVNWQK